MKKKLVAIAVAFLMMFVADAAYSQWSGTDYQVGAVRSAQGVATGVIVDVVRSHMEDPASISTRVVGGGLGAAACAAATDRWSSWAAKAAVMTACGAVGERVADRAARSVEATQTFIVKLDSGGTMAVLQQDPYLQRGDRVYLLTGQGSRIVKAGT